MSDRQNWWRQWLEQPQRTKLHSSFFQLHFWIGTVAGLYLTLLTVTGSIVVYANDLPEWDSIRWLVKLHTSLFAGSIGRIVNGVGGVCLTLLCLTGAIIWWQGVKHWRRSLWVNWRSGFPRFNWDLHSALGFWCFIFILLWALSGTYFAFPKAFSKLYALDPSDRFVDQGLFWLSELHFGRFNWFTKVLWSVLGLVPGVLAFTGMFVCCRRVIFKKHSNPYRQ